MPPIATRPAVGPSAPHHPLLPWLVLLLPSLLAVMALRGGGIPFKLGVPASCAGLLLVTGCTRRWPDTWYLVGAFGFSIVGDWFLSTRAGRESFYLAGIGAFFVAHLGYLAFAWRNGRLHRASLVGLLTLLGGWFVLQLGPAMPSRALAAASLGYLVISCLSFAAAAGLRLTRTGWGLYLLGIGLIVFSDAMIAVNDFLKIRGVGWLILPTYYLAQMVITVAVLREPGSGRRAKTSGDTATNKGKPKNE